MQYSLGFQLGSGYIKRYPTLLVLDGYVITLDGDALTLNLSL